MIQRLAQTSISFTAEAAPRDVYENMMSRNSQTVQKQNNAVANICLCLYLYIHGLSF